MAHHFATINIGVPAKEREYYQKKYDMYYNGVKRRYKYYKWLLENADIPSDETKEFEIMITRTHDLISNESDYKVACTLNACTSLCYGLMNQTEFGTLRVMKNRYDELVYNTLFERFQEEQHKQMIKCFISVLRKIHNKFKGDLDALREQNKQLKKELEKAESTTYASEMKYTRAKESAHEKLRENRVKQREFHAMVRGYVMGYFPEYMNLSWKEKKVNEKEYMYGYRHTSFAGYTIEKVKLPFEVLEDELKKYDSSEEKRYNALNELYYIIPDTFFNHSAIDYEYDSRSKLETLIMSFGPKAVNGVKIIVPKYLADKVKDNTYRVSLALNSTDVNFYGKKSYMYGPNLYRNGNRDLGPGSDGDFATSNGTTYIYFDMIDGIVSNPRLIQHTNWHACFSGDSWTDRGNAHPIELVDTLPDDVYTIDYDLMLQEDDSERVIWWMYRKRVEYLEALDKDSSVLPGDEYVEGKADETTDTTPTSELPVEHVVISEG
jgi:hypothetical protein